MKLMMKTVFTRAMLVVIAIVVALCWLCSGCSKPVQGLRQRNFGISWPPNTTGVKTLPTTSAAAESLALKQRKYEMKIPKLLQRQADRHGSTSRLTEREALENA